MNEPPGARLRVGLSGLTMAEYFRDQGQDVLLFIDNIFRFVQAGSEVSALLGGCRPRSATSRRSPPRWGQLQERITSTNKGAVTSVQATTCQPTTSPTRPRRRPSPTSTRRPSCRARSWSRASIPPWIRSTRRRVHFSRGSSPTITTRTATRVQEVLQRYKDLQDIIAILGIEELSDEGPSRRAARTQDPALPVAADFPSPRQFTGTPGQYVKLEDTIRGFTEILDGQHDDLPEQAFYMVGPHRGCGRSEAKQMAEAVEPGGPQDVSVSIVTPDGPGVRGRRGSGDRPRGRPVRSASSPRHAPLDRDASRRARRACILRAARCSSWRPAPGSSRCSRIGRSRSSTTPSRRRRSTTPGRGGNSKRRRRSSPRSTAATRPPTAGRPSSAIKHAENMLAVAGRG